MDKLREVVRNSNLAHHYLLEANELRKSIPCPLPGRLLVSNSGAFISMAGMPELVDYAKSQYELAKRKVERGEGHLKEEKRRIAFLYTPVAHFPDLYDWIEREYSSIVVIDMMGNYIHKPIEDLSSPSSILKGLAKKLASLPMARESRGPAK